MGVSEQYREVVAFIREGKSISAIKHARQAWGLGLKEAKDLVEAIIETHYAWKAEQPPPVDGTRLLALRDIVT